MSAEIGILLVHGIGSQIRGETLVHFGEPIYEALRDRVKSIREDDEVKFLWCVSQSASNRTVAAGRASACEVKHYHQRGRRSPNRFNHSRVPLGNFISAAYFSGRDVMDHANTAVAVFLVFCAPTKTVSNLCKSIAEASL